MDNIKVIMDYIISNSMKEISLIDTKFEGSNKMFRELQYGIKGDT